MRALVVADDGVAEQLEHADEVGMAVVFAVVEEHRAALVGGVVFDDAAVKGQIIDGVDRAAGAHGLVVRDRAACQAALGAAVQADGAAALCGLVSGNQGAG